jgi:hypothetical protein
MQKFLALLVLAFFGFIIFASYSNNPPNVKKDLTQARELIKNQFNSDQEPTAIEAIWARDTIFKVGVIDDGTKRDGYAQSVCGALYEAGFKGERIMVSVIDIAKLKRDKEWIEIGRSLCN